MLEVGSAERTLKTWLCAFSHQSQARPFSLCRGDTSIAALFTGIPISPGGLAALFGADLSPVTIAGSPAPSGHRWGAGTRWQWQMDTAPAQVPEHWAQPQPSPHSSRPLPSQQRCYQHCCGQTERSRRITAELTKGNFAVQNIPRGYLQCSSSRPVYLMKQQHSGFHVICAFC